MSKSPAVTPRWALARALGFTTLGVLLSPHRAATQMPDDGPRTTFLFARYATRTSRALYTGYGNESWQGILALIENPRTGYHEALMGVAKRITLAQRQSTIIALARSDASDSRYGEIYVVPSLAIAPLALTGSAEIAVPLGAQGTLQYYINPLSVHVPVDSRLRVGATYILAGQVGTMTGEALGPSVRAVVPHGAFTFDWVLGLRAYHTETRLSFQTSL